MNDLRAEIQFSILLPRKNANFFSYALSQKSTIRIKHEKKQFLNQDFWKKSDFETAFQQRVRLKFKIFKTCHILYFEPTLNNSLMFESEQYSVSSLVFSIASELESRFLQRIRFRWKNCFWKNIICWKTRPQTMLSYLVNLHRKNVKVGFLCFLAKVDREKLFFFKKLLKKISFWIIFWTTLHILNQEVQKRQTKTHFFKTRWMSNRKFQKVSDFETTTFTTDQILKWI